jgi:hypothetical protein
MRLMTGDALSPDAMHVFRVQDFPGVAAKAVVVNRFYAGMRLVTFIAIEPRHGHLDRERGPGRGPMAAQAPFPVRNEHAGFLRGKRMTHGTGHLFHAHSVYLPVLVASQAGVLFRMERMHCSLVAIPARKLFDIDVAGVARRTVHRDGTLGYIVPMTFHTGLPGSLFSVRLRCLPVGREHEFDQQPVLLNDPELVAVLTNDVPVAGQFPGGICLLHQMATAAKLGILLYISIIANSKDNAEYADDKQDRDKNGLVAGAETPVELIEQIFQEFYHAERQPCARENDLAAI